jgi:hypothetical protein
MPMDRVVVGVVPSERIAGKSYDITQTGADDALGCSCVAFSYSKASPPTCKHIAAWQLQQLEPEAALPMTTFTGRVVYPLRPCLADIDIRDIAHALAAVNRFNGHTHAPYSVGQHSVLVSQLVPPEDALHALLHDGSETYLTDIPRSVKRLPFMATYCAVEAVWQQTIFRRFGLRSTMPASVKPIDEAIAVNEAQDLFTVAPMWAANGTRLPVPVITPWPAPDAERVFLMRFRELRRAGKA